MRYCSNCGRALTDDEIKYWEDEKDEVIECDSCIIHESETMYD